MDHAIISPIKYLSQLNKQFGLGLHVCYVDLAHAHKQYRDFYRTVSKRGETVLLDYSYKTPRDIPLHGGIVRVKSVIEYISPKAVILPDSDLHLKKTIQSAEDTISFLKRQIGNIPVIGMIQGISEDQYSKCLNRYMELMNIHPFMGICLPSSMEKILPRHTFITEIYQPGEFGLPLYMSDIFDGLREVSTVQAHTGIQKNLIQGGWSSLPLRMAYAGRLLPDMGVIRPSPDPITFLEDYIPELLVDNLDRYIGVYS